MTPTGDLAQARPDHGYAFVTGAAYGLLVVIGALLGLVGTFAHGLADLVLSDSGMFSRLPIGALVMIIITGALCRLAGFGMRTRMAAALVGLPWLLVSYLFSLPRAEGDVVIAGDLAGGVYLYGGLILVAIAIVITPPGHRTPRTPPSAPLLGGGTAR